MKISIIGASAGLGLETVKLALERGHVVTTLSRSDIPIPENIQLHQVLGNATAKNDLAQAIDKAGAILVTLGTRKNMKQTTLFSDFAKQLVALHNETNFQAPVLVVTGFGTGDSGNYVGWFVRFFIKYFLKDVYADKAQMEEIITQSKMNWIIVRPGQLKDEPLTENYRVETELFKGINIGAINRADVADYLIKQAENPSELGKYPALSAK